MHEHQQQEQEDKLQNTQALRNAERFAVASEWGAALYEIRCCLTEAMQEKIGFPPPEEITNVQETVEHFLPRLKRELERTRGNSSIPAR